MDVLFTRYRVPEDISSQHVVDVNFRNSGIASLHGPLAVLRMFDMAFSENDTENHISFNSTAAPNWFPS